jgi:hypothetical protein
MVETAATGPARRDFQRKEFFMRTMLTTTAVALALLVPGAAAVHAQAGSDDTGGTTGMMTTTPRDSSDDAAGTRGTMVSPPGSEPSAVNQTGGGDASAMGTTARDDGGLGSMRGEQVIGQTLYGADGEEIGEISDVAMRQGGTNPEFVVGVGGFLGIGERQVAIPIDQVRMQGDRLTTTMTKDSIGALQPYEASGYQPMDRNRTMSGG